VRMRWLGGDLLWLRSVMTYPGGPDVPTRGRALGRFLADFARPIGYDYLARDDLRPAFSAAGGAVSRAAALARLARSDR
jgi:hypothetical protein